MKAIPALAIILFAFSASAATIRESNKFSPIGVESKSNLSSDVNLIITPRDATPVRKFEFHCNVIDAEGYSPCGAIALTHPAGPQVATTIEEKSPAFLPHCEWVSVSGGVCGGSAFIAPAIPVSATPEPAPLILFGTVILGAFAITKFRG